MAITQGLVIYTDLDGTFLDHDSYSYQPLLPSLTILRRLGVPVIFCSSKTRAEIEALQLELKEHTPFISENGGAVYIQERFFDFSFEFDRQQHGYYVVEFGTPYDQLVQALREIQQVSGVALRHFDAMSIEEVAEVTGLKANAARLAKAREYDEPFWFLSEKEEGIERVLRLIKDRGLNFTRGGRYYHLHGNNSKGHAVAALSALFRRQRDNLLTAGIGDSLNDLPMLEVVDIAVLVQKPGGVYDESVLEALPEVKLAGEAGPRGWNRAVLELLIPRIAPGYLLES